ncbi:Protein YhfA [Zhongshania aliphaticivorans]|uniref:Protein YhfA n=2 Tax=Zhongshania aliphaticivorans TaxID=1470434 RepID=A0A5S9MYL7_9GAMM|nr:Protein YhfA [Zhongshania aliphaticivorans]CAA0084369.1 Protein YhfA [Zhongshania aliphaticivorans]
MTCFACLGELESEPCGKLSAIFQNRYEGGMKATVKWVDGAMFLGESGSGHSVVMDGPEDHGGRNMGVRPMEMLLVGMGGCASFDVMSMLKKSRQEVIDCRCELEAERADAVPAVFTKIHLHFLVSGKNLKEAHVKRAVELSAEKYCSASIMMEAAGVEVSHSHEIVDGV